MLDSSFQYVTDSITTGIKRPIIERQIAPTRPINESISGRTKAITTKNKYVKIIILSICKIRQQ